MAKKEKVKNLFDSIAPAYDFLNHMLSLNIDRSWRKKAAAKAVAKGRARILDVACGTADFSLEMAEISGAQCKITGMDISEKMLEIGREKVQKKNMSDRISLVYADCEDIPYPDGSYDSVTSAFGVRNFENLEQGLSEMHRVLKSGGKAVILELSVPDNRILGTLYNFYFTRILPGIGGKISSNASAYRYLPASVIGFPAPDKFCTILRERGFANVSCESLTFGICRIYTGEKI